MGNSSKGIFLAIGGAVVLAAGLAAVYSKVLAPRGDKRVAQEEVDAWSKRWTAARACLVGPSPHSSDGYAAVVLRDALDPQDTTASLRSCSKLVNALRREKGYSAGAKLERAWSQIHRRWKQLGEAHAWRVAKTPNRPLAERRESYAKSLADMDKAFDELRKRANLPAVPPAGPAIPQLPWGRPVTDRDGTPLATSSTEFVGDVLLTEVTIRDRRWLWRQTGPDVVDLIPIGIEVLPSIDDNTWGVWVDEPDDQAAPFQLRTGAIDERGEPTGQEVSLPTDSRRLETRAVFAVGKGSDRVIYYEQGTEDNAGHLVRSRDRGASWSDHSSVRKGSLFERYVFVNAALRRLDLVWKQGAVYWLSIDGGDLSRPLEPVLLTTDGIPVAAPCHSGSHTWWPILSSLYLVDQPGQPARKIPGSDGVHEDVRCIADRLMALNARYGSEERRVLVCGPEGCSTGVLPGVAGAEMAPVLSATRGALVAVDTSGVVVFWAGDPAAGVEFEPAEVVRLAEGQRLEGVVEWNGVLHLVSKNDKEELQIVSLAPPVSSLPRNRPAGVRGDPARAPEAG